MAYNVGADLRDKRINNAWMVASNNHFIPTAFIVDRHGKVAWIGSPFVMDAALTAVLTSSGDPAKAVATAKRKEDATLRLLESAAKRGDLHRVLSMVDTLPDSVSLDTTYGQLADVSVALAQSFAQALIRNPKVGMWQFLDIISCIVFNRSNVSHSSPSERRQEFALAVQLAKTAQTRADPSEDSHLACLQYLALAYEKSGDLPAAAHAQQAQIELMQHSKKDYSDDLPSAKKQLAAYLAGKFPILDRH